MDDQVKLSGYRFELGEIEHAVRQLSTVRECVVLLREDVDTRPALVAYVLPTEECQPSATELRASLRRFLPEYMIPTHWVFLERLPLTNHGKIARSLLPLPSPAASRDPAQNYVAPQSERQRITAAVWADVLKVDRVGIEDNFFDLGGHSLLLVQLGRRLSEALGRNIPLLDLFRYPTIASFTASLAGTPSEIDQVTDIERRLTSGHERRALRRRLMSDIN